MKVYKIRDSKTGLYSTGGGFPGWKPVGKVWTGMGPVNNHLAVVLKVQKRIPSTWVIERYELVFNGFAHVVPVEEGK